MGYRAEEGGAGITPLHVARPQVDSDSLAETGKVSGLASLWGEVKSSLWLCRERAATRL